MLAFAGTATEHLLKKDTRLHRTEKDDEFVKRAGTDVTIIALAYSVHEALAVAEELAREGIAVEVVDPRTLVPLDVDTVRASPQSIFEKRCVSDNLLFFDPKR